MIKYSYYYCLFHTSRLLQALPGLPFKLWVVFMQKKLYAAKKMAKALETDWDKEVTKIAR